MGSLVVSAALLMSCGGAPSDEPAALDPAISNPAISSPAADAAATRAVVEHGTVDVRAHGCGPQPDRGTGSVIDDAGLIVTSAHVIAGADAVDVTGPDGSADGEVVWFDDSLDIAVVRVDSAVGAAVPVTAVAPATPTTGLVARGEPSGDGSIIAEADIVRSVTIATTDIYRRRDVARPGFEVAATIMPGDSGSMVYADGVGIGIIWARSTATADRAWAVALPEQLTDARLRAGLVDPVEHGHCP